MDRSGKGLVAIGGTKLHFTHIGAIRVQLQPSLGRCPNAEGYRVLAVKGHVTEGSGIAVPHGGEGEGMVGVGIGGNADRAAQLAGVGGGQALGSGDGAAHTRGGLLHLADAAAGLKEDGLGADVAGEFASVGGAVVEDVPLTLEAFHRAVIVPDLGIATEIVDDDTAVLEAVEGVIRNGVAQRRGSAVLAVGISVAVSIGKEVVILVSDPLDRASLMEFMLLHGQGLGDGFGDDLHHVVLELGGLAPGDLPPIDIGLAVVVHEDRGVDAPHPLQLSHVSKGARGGLGFRHAAPTVGDAVVEVVPPVTVAAIGGVQHAAVLGPRGIRQGKGYPVIHPIHEIIGGIDVVDVAAKAAISHDVQGAVEVDPPVDPDVGLAVGDEDVVGEKRIVR